MKQAVRVILGMDEIRPTAVENKGHMPYRLFLCQGDPSDPSNWQERAGTGKICHTLNDLDSHRSYHFHVPAFSSAGEIR